MVGTYRGISCFGTRQLFWDKHFLLISSARIYFMYQLWVKRIPLISLDSHAVQDYTFDLLEDAVFALLSSSSQLKSYLFSVILVTKMKMK